MNDPLDNFIAAAVQALELPFEPAWQPAIKANLAVTLRQAALVTEFPLPDDTEPAPVFQA
jgi:1-carboxybiuret hydrolase subunit AtzG-like protein